MRTLGSVLKMPRMIPRVSNKPDMSHAVQGIRMASPSNERMQRIKKCEFDSEAFARTYFPRHFSKAFCEMHRYVFNRMDISAKHRGVREAIIGPRKFGKTTQINVVLPIWHMAYRRRRFALILGESAGAAESNLSTITQELETNELLLEDFPHLKPAIDPKGQYVKWTDRQIVLKEHQTMVAKGMGSRMRGIKYRDQRPDLAVIDDPQSPETADTFLKRRRVKRWFGGTFMGLGDDDWDIWMIGNLPHHDALIAEKVLDPEWKGIMFMAINRPSRPEDRYPRGNTKVDGSPLWPEGWPLEKLDAYKRDKSVGALGFAREMMNDPREEEDKPFVSLKFAKERVPTDDLRGWMKRTLVATATAVDPAGGSNPGEYKKGIRDWCCIVSGGRDRKGFIHIFAVKMTKDPPDKQIELILDEYDALRTKQIGVEEIMFKNLYKRDLQRAGRERKLYPRVSVVKQPRTNKQTRILGVQPALMDRPQTVIFAEHLFDEVPEFFAMFDEFPAGHDDGPDATEMLVGMLERVRTKAVPQGVGGASYWKGKVAS